METLRNKISQILNKPKDSDEVQKYYEVFTKHDICEHTYQAVDYAAAYKCTKCGHMVKSVDVANNSEVLSRVLNAHGGRMNAKTRAIYHAWYKQHMK